jgi:ferredoxin--NADP+ reductase
LDLDAASTALLEDPEVDPTLAFKMKLAEEFADRPVDPANRRVVFRYLVSPLEILGTDRVEGLRIIHNELVEVDGKLKAKPTELTEAFDASLVLRSTGFRGRPLPGLPFDEQREVIPNDQGRVIGHDGQPVPGLYVAGWIKRGATGTIGTNKHCARETVASLIDDFMSDRLAAPEGDRRSLHELLKTRQPDLVSGRGWRAIDEAERRRGRSGGRPRVKFTNVAEMVEIATGRKTAVKPARLPTRPAAGGVSEL